MTETIKFEQSDSYLGLNQNGIHVWHAKWEQFVGKMEAVLSDAERERAERFRFKKDRDRYATSRGILRKLLGKYLAVSPYDLEFRYGSHGKPYLTEKSFANLIHFNVSHSHELTLFAFSRDQEIGIDVERIRKDFEFENIATRFLTPRALAVLDALRDEARTAEFFRLWTRMEACAKAEGFGISLLDAAESSKRLKDDVCSSNEYLPTGRIQDFTPAFGYVASVASASPISSLTHWNFSASSGNPDFS
jgi:4'-phosphopantetheinyl transferase